jgi:hypothetical protein
LIYSQITFDVPEDTLPKVLADFIDGPLQADRFKRLSSSTIS